ncbi:MAG: phosphate acetyltransferase [Sulfuricella sp.]|nr:phosphate acetyltransferase [Sulfuricella sp.]
MANRLYVAGAAPRSGKSAVSLGFMELFSAYGERVGFFRPIVATANDSVIALMAERYRLPGPLSAYYGCLAKEAHALSAAGGNDEVIKIVLEKFKALETQFDLIICEGSDFDRATPGLEFDFNVELANHLDCMIVAVLNGKERGAADIAEDVQAIVASLAERHCQIFAIVVNRVDEAVRGATVTTLAGRASAEPPVYLLAERPILDMPTVGEVATALGAAHIGGSSDGLSREVLHFKVAAMELPHFLDHVEHGSLIITPGDRADIIVGSLLADASAHYPQIAGLLLTGGLQPAPQILKLIDGLARSGVPLLSVAGDTFTTATAVNGIESRLGPGNPRKIAAALGLLEGQMDRQALAGRFTLAAANHVTPLRFEYELIQRAKQVRKHIVLPEGNEERILKAAEILLLRDVVDITLLGNPEEIRRSIAQLGLRLDKARVIDPCNSELRQRYAAALHAERRLKGVTAQMAWDMVEDVSYFGTMMVLCGDADGMVSGALHTTQHTIRPAFQVIRARPGASLISSVFLMSLPDQVVVYGDCAVNPEPSAEQLAEIAITSAATAARFGIEPRVAMLSYSTGESGVGPAVERVREAVRIAHQRAPQLMLEGPIQYDAAVDAAVARTKLPGSEVAGRATVFIFPDLNTGNNTYKAVQRSSGAVAIGPILQGLNKPVNDLSRGCTVTDIVNTVAITAIQAQQEVAGTRN